MAIGIYKQGQGYWVRMMTAIVAGILVLACAAWVWQSLDRIQPPSSGLIVRFEQPVGTTPAVGSSIDLFASGDTYVMATATVRSVEEDGGGQLMRVSNPVLTQEARTAKRAVVDARSIRAAGDFSAGIPTSGIVAIPAFEMIYVRLAVASLVILAGAVLIFLYVGKKPKTVDFLIATDGEARKVNWSTRKEVIGSTWVVIAAMFLIALTLFIIDLAFQGIFSAIGVLER